MKMVLCLQLFPSTVESLDFHLRAAKPGDVLVVSCQLAVWSTTCSTNSNNNPGAEACVCSLFTGYRESPDSG